MSIFKIIPPFIQGNINVGVFGDRNMQNLIFDPFPSTDPKRNRGVDFISEEASEFDTTTLIIPAETTITYTIGISNAKMLIVKAEFVDTINIQPSFVIGLTYPDPQPFGGISSIGVREIFFSGLETSPESFTLENSSYYAMRFKIVLISGV